MIKINTEKNWYFFFLYFEITDSHLSPGYFSRLIEDGDDGLEDILIPEPIVSFSRRRLGTRHEELSGHTKFEFFHWL